VDLLLRVDDDVDVVVVEKKRRKGRRTVKRFFITLVPRASNPSI